MKKIILTLLILSTFTSCTEDDIIDNSDCTLTPTLTTNDVTFINNSIYEPIESITFSGVIVAPTCESTVTSQGFVYARTTLPKTDDNVIEIYGEDISKTLYNLNFPGHTFYYRTFFTNPTGTYYGNQIKFEIPIPEVAPIEYNLSYTVDMHGNGSTPIPFEFQATFIITNENNQRVEYTQTISGFTSNTDHYETNSIVVENYKIVGVKIIAVSNNIGSLSINLQKVSDQENLWNKHASIDNSTEITYDFDTNTDNVIQS